MKKRFFVQSVALIFSFIFLAIVIDKIDSTYRREAKVNSIEGNTVTFEDSSGNFWEWEQTREQFQIKEKVTLIMNTKGTDSNIRDDEIIKIKRK